ncbi:MAG: toll/interleukin-1 receptor domain-containing protein, partial [Proteobacteria bacterium]|nr:toll/interleukin-1 receptor domain-containing protein [Pseudomonadota bacterium]
MPGKVFVSYSQQDEAWMTRLVQQLEALADEGLKVWTDQKIPPGADWFPEIEAAMAECQV